MPERSLRADAQRNRDRLLAAARVVVAEQGGDASLEEIARRAGVGSATLHRHFDSRQALLEAVFAGYVDGVCAAATALLDDPHPADALVAWLHAVLRHATRNRGLGTALLAGLRDPAVGATFHNRILAAGEELLARARSARQVREDVLVTELLQLVDAISLVSESQPEPQRRAERLLTVAVEGIRRHPSR
jgi:AcrR family transcriptional regulator